MPNSAGHEICPANNSQITNNCKIFLVNIAEKERFSANTFVSIFIFISRESFMLSCVKHAKSFITSGPEHNQETVQDKYNSRTVREHKSDFPSAQFSPFYPDTIPATHHNSVRVGVFYIRIYRVYLFVLIDYAK